MKKFPQLISIAISAAVCAAAARDTMPDTWVATDAPGRVLPMHPESIPLTLFPCNWSNDRLVENLQHTLDEFYVFEAALSEEQVRNLYQKNQIHSSQSTNDNP